MRYRRRSLSTSSSIVGLNLVVIGRVVVVLWSKAAGGRVRGGRHFCEYLWYHKKSHGKERVNILTTVLGLTQIYGCINSNRCTMVYCTLCMAGEEHRVSQPVFVSGTLLMGLNLSLMVNGWNTGSHRSVWLGHWFSLCLMTVGCNTSSHCVWSLARTPGVPLVSVCLQQCVP